MADWPNLLSGQRFEAGGAVTSGDSGGTTFTAGATNTKGSYAELIASTSFDAAGFLFQLHNVSAAGDFLFDIAVGAGGSEVVVVANLHLSGKENVNNPIYIPLAIPAGTRIAVRAQASINVPTGQVSVILMASGLQGGLTYGRCTTYGAATADSGLTGVDPGTTANTKGSYAQITASTTNRIRWLIVAIGGQNNFSYANYKGWLIDIAIGAAASEVVLIPNIGAQVGANVDVITPFLVAFPVDIPAGTRIAARAQSNSNSSPERLLDIGVYGFD